MILILIIFSPFVLVTLAFLWGWFVENNWFHLKSIRLKWAKKLQKPITILHISDTHFVEKESASKKRFFQRLSMLNPDLIFLTGDIIDNNGGIEPAVKFISGLRARYGTYMVLGNHDYYDYSFWSNFTYHMGMGAITRDRNDADRLVEEMKKIGVHTLRNESTKVNVHGNLVLIAGTEDPITQPVDFEKTLHDLSPKTFNILLTHHLDCLLKLHHRGIDMVFAGHTHGGQIRLPLLGPIIKESRISRKMMDGLHDYNGMKTFVSRGLGNGRTSAPRFLCRPEAVFFELRS